MSESDYPTLVVPLSTYDLECIAKARRLRAARFRQARLLPAPQHPRGPHMNDKDLPQLATGASPRAVRTYQIGGALHAMATHFDHGDGWYYSRDIGDLEHIRYRSDHTGYNHWWRRFKRAFDWKHLTGRDGISKAFRLRPDPHPFLSALAWIQVSLPKDKNLPDGKVGPVYTSWEEDGEYIEMVGPTIGERIALFLMSEPEHWHAQTIAAEIDRIAFRKDRS